jgi:hypothetical protein
MANNDRIDPLENMAFQEDSLFYGSVSTLEQLAKIADAAIATIRSSETPRLVVIETWLILDYAIREFLISGLDLDKFNVSSFDLRYRLLPKSLSGCLDILRGLADAHGSLDPPPHDKRLTYRLGYLRFLKERHPEEFERLLQLEREYYRECAPELLLENSTQAASLPPAHPSAEHTHLPKDWLNIAGRLDDQWFRNARRLNEARNHAAHVYDQNRILSTFGLAGPNALSLLKSQCEILLASLVGVARPTADLGLQGADRK